MSVVDSSLLLAAPLAFAAGAVSFASPCVLPLVPGYLSYVTGLSGADLADSGGGEGGGENPGAAPSRRALLPGVLLFVAGFSIVFTSYGALFGEAGALLRLHQRLVEIVLGVLTIVLGLAFAGVLSRVSWLQREVRLHRLPRAGLAGAPLLGALFAVGWAPCIGPTLAAVLTLAASTDAATAGRGALLTFIYCLGLGLPFVITALALRRALGVFRAVRRHYRAVLTAGGLMLVAVGVLEVTGLWQQLILAMQTSYSGYTPPL